MSTTRTETSAVRVDPERWVEEHGDCLYRYALARVRTPEKAEDLVQETLLAGVRSQERFSGRSSVRSWLVGILKHKVTDHFRQLGREMTFTDLEFLQDECAPKFVEGGWWNHDRGPREWRPAADVAMQNAEFWLTFDTCLGKLPTRVAAVFTLRELEDTPSRDVCRILKISESNLWVMLHRARMALRECLEVRWFDRASKP